MNAAILGVFIFLVTLGLTLSVSAGMPNLEDLVDRLIILVKSLGEKVNALESDVQELQNNSQGFTAKFKRLQDDSVVGGSTGWNPGCCLNFTILDSDVIEESVVALNVDGAAVGFSNTLGHTCSVKKLLPGVGFVIDCTTAVQGTNKLNYVLFNPAG